MLRSKSELIIYEMLLQNGLNPIYEKSLELGEDGKALPDFTLTINDTPVYWEHLGLPGDTGYRKHWERKREVYERHGISESAGNLCLSRDDPASGALDCASIQQTIEALLKRHGGRK